MKQPLGVWITDTHLSENTLEVNFKVFSQVWELCKKNGISTIFHGGDIFTSRKGQPEVVVNAFKQLVDETYRQGLKIIAIAGNHDKTDYTSQSSFLDAFDGHPSLSVISPYGSLTFEELVIHFLPYYDEDLKYNDILSELEVDSEKINILLTHIAIDGIKNNGDIKVENDIKQDLFDKFDTVLAGHYHNKQIVGSRDHIIYTGSAYQANFGEDIEKGATIIYDDGSIEFVGFDFPQYTTINIKSEDIDASLLKKLKDTKNQAKDDLMIRFRVEGDIDESKKSLVVELQQFSRVEVVRESFKPIDIVHSESVQITGSDILSLYNQWIIDRNIENSEYGKQLLQKVI